MNKPISYWSSNHDLKNTLAFILAGGRGSRLKHLTNWRVKPAVPFGGKYLIIDFVLSNCINSNIRKIEVLTQYKSQSLIQHIIRGWDLFHPELDEFVECIPAQMKVNGDWYVGTANAIYQNIDLIRYHNPLYVLVLAGDHIYKMDYGDLLANHKCTGASITIAAIEVPTQDAYRFGILKVDDENRVISFIEKPNDLDEYSSENQTVLASMGIYIFNTKILLELLNTDANLPCSTHDFGKDIIPSVIATEAVFAFPFVDSETQKPGYWQDVGTIDSYYNASMDLIGFTPQLNLYDETWPLRTAPNNFPPAKFIFNDDNRRGTALDSIIGEGCIISGAHVEHSLLSTNVLVEQHSIIKNSIILPNVSIGFKCRLTNVIIDKGCIIPENTVIGENREEDQLKYNVSKGGITLVEPEMLGQNVHHIE